MLLPCIACADRSQPNIVLILADDLGYGDIGAYGAKLINTPNMDTLASQGVRLTQFYTSGNVCTPSRAGLLTGRYPIRVGLADKTLSIGDSRGLRSQEVTVAKELKKLGYVTALIGKWHLGDKPEYHPQRHGFDEFFGIAYSNDESEQPLLRGKKSVQERINPQMLGMQFIDETLAVIERNRTRPFFIFLSSTSPHKPLIPSPDFAGKSQAGAYGDVIEELDWGVGQVLGALSKYGIEDNTLVIVTSDNGPFPEGSTGGLRGGKGSAGWEGGYRVPFIARWPQGIKQNTKSSAMAMNIDIMPTLITIAGGDGMPSSSLDGKDISQLLKGSDRSPHGVLYFFNNEKIAAVRTQKWKAVFQSEYRNINRWLPDHDVRLLFDMEEDPYEQYSLAANHEGVWEQMIRHLAEGVESLGSRASASSQK